MPGENDDCIKHFHIISEIYREIAVAPSCVAVRVLVLSAGASDAEGLDTLESTLRPATMSTGSWRPWPTTRL